MTILTKYFNVKTILINIAHNHELFLDFRYIEGLLRLFVTYAGTKIIIIALCSM